MDDWAAFIGAPVVVIGLSYILGWKLYIISEMIAAISITTGLLFALVVFVFQLRLQMASEDMRHRVPPQVVQLVNQMFANVAYSIVVGFLTTGVLLVGAALRDLGGGSAPVPLGTVWTSLVLGATTHFALALAMCLKRLVSAFKRLGNL